MPRFIDLSHPLTDGQLGFAGDPDLSITVHDTIASSGYNLTRISMATHQGTHIDAPYHFVEEGKTVDQMPLEWFYGPAWLVDLAPGGCLPAKTAITIDMLRPHADKFQPGARVLFRTGWDRTFGTRECFGNGPNVTQEAAQWIADRRIRLLGMDTMTPNVDWMDVHLTLLGKDVEIVIVEALTNLDKLPERFTFVGFPLNIKGRDGSPIRAVAIVE